MVPLARWFLEKDGARRCLPASWPKPWKLIKFTRRSVFSGIIYTIFALFSIFAIDSLFWRRRQPQYRDTTTWITVLPSNPIDPPRDVNEVLYIPRYKSNSIGFFDSVVVGPNGEILPDPCLAGWSAGSAFFTIMALAMCFYAQPTGSSNIREPTTLWRLSPLFVLLDIISVLARFAEGLLRGYRFNTVCLAILGAQSRNAWTRFEPNLFPGLLGDNKDGNGRRPDDDDDDDSSLPQAEQTSAFAPWHLPRFRPAGSIPFATTYEDSSHADAQDVRNWLDRHAQILQNRLGGKPKPRFETLTDDEKDLMLGRHMQQALAINDGNVSGRLFVWVLVLLQVIKLSSVSSAVLARSLGFVYFGAWFLNEMMIVCISLRPPWTTQPAIRLGRRWDEDSSGIFWALGVLFNGYVTCCMLIGSDMTSGFNICPDWSCGEGLPSAFPRAVLFTLSTISISFALFWLSIFIFLLIGSVFGIVIDLTTKRGDRIWDMIEEPNYMCALCATTTFLLLVLSFNGPAIGLETDFAFTCSGTKKPEWYDWLG